MRIDEILSEAITEVDSFWYHPKTGEFIDTSNIEHTEYVLKNPEKFGLGGREIYRFVTSSKAVLERRVRNSVRWRSSLPPMRDGSADGSMERN